MMNYAEAAYFDGAHVQHIADWQDRQRVQAIRARSEALVRRVTR